MSDAMTTGRSKALAAITGLSILGLMLAGCGTVTGAAIGAGSGAAISAGTGHSPARGALIGAGVGAAAGTIYDVAR
jgi:hypothetical protein